jgi:hypothetical protein
MEEEDHQLPKLRARLRKLTKARLRILLEEIQLELDTRNANEASEDERAAKRARVQE